MSSTSIVIISLSIITILSPHSTLATRLPDLFESALDIVLCQGTEQMFETIIDIRSSIKRGASLVDGKFTSTLDTCIKQCCSVNECDFALYKMEGTSASGKNCYFVNCGDKRSNCVMVEHNGFTSVVMGRRGKENGREMVSTPSTQPPTPPTTTSPPPTYVTLPVTTVPPSHGDQETTTSYVNKESDSKTTNAPRPVPVSHSKLTPKLKPSNQSANSKSDSDKKVNGAAGVEENRPNMRPNDEGSGIIAAVIVGVVCLCVVVIVVGVLSRKIWTDQRRKRFRNVDYLINGMYT